LEHFARLQVTFDKKEGLSNLGEADIVTIYPGIRSDFAAIAHASYACELVAAFMPEHHPNQRLYRLLTAYLARLDGGTAEPSDRHFFEMNLLNILGYRPPLESCPGCGAPLAECGCCWSADGCYCHACSRGMKMATLGASAIVLLLQALKTGQFGVVRFPERDRREVESFLDAFIAGNLHRPLKSLPFLRLSP
jgi:DNA repair protein RecO (recombination protein O)